MDDQPQTWSVVERAKAGDSGALAELYATYGHLVHRVAYRLTRNAQDADDVLQDVFVALPEALRSYAGTGSLEGWIKTIAARTTLMMLRKERHRREVRYEPLEMDGAAEGPEPLVDRVALDRAMSMLPDPLRVVFILKEVEGYSHDEIGEMLGIGVSASTSKLHRARKSLRELLRSTA